MVQIFTGFFFQYCNIPFGLVFIIFTVVDHSLQMRYPWTACTCTFFTVRLFACISYHLKSSCLKTSCVAPGFIVEVGGRSGSGALSRGTSHQSNLWPLVPLITRLLMAMSLGENQFVAKDDGRWSLQPITEWLRTAEGTNQSLAQKLKSMYLLKVHMT